MLQLTDFCKAYGDKIIFQDFSLSIDAGEMVAITGASGSGKTTLLNTLGLIETVEKGQYTFCGYRNVQPNSRLANRLIREKISYLFQNFALVDYLTVADNLQMALRYSKEGRDVQHKRMSETLCAVGLPNVLQQKVCELSGGEQQRVAIARAILKPSELILADEPTGALDEGNRNDILEQLLELNHSGKTIVLVTHDAKVAAMCHRVIPLTAVKQ